MADDTGPLVSTAELLHAFEHGMEAPDLLSWKEWQHWRANEGRRPAVRRGDTMTTTITEESLMWREVMSAIFGPEWRAGSSALYKDVMQNSGTDGGGQLEDSHPGIPAVRGGQLGAEQFDGVQQDAGDGNALAAETEPEGRSVAGASRSIASEGPVSGESLRQRLMIGILKDESADDFIDRVDRIASALEAIKDPVSQEDLAEISGRGEYLGRIREVAPDTQISWLNSEFAQTVTNDVMPKHEQTGRCRALIELLRLRGQHPSARQERLFSTASNSPQQTPGGSPRLKREC